jgi:hypothetical protein
MILLASPAFSFIVRPSSTKLASFATGRVAVRRLSSEMMDVAPNEGGTVVSTPPIIQADIAKQQQEETVLGWLKSDDFKRTAVWLGFVVSATLLRGFYSLILGTFVMTLLGNQVGEKEAFGLKSCLFFPIICVLHSTPPSNQAVNLSQRLWGTAALLVKTKWPNLNLKAPPRKAFCGIYILTVFCAITTGTVSEHLRAWMYVEESLVSIEFEQRISQELLPFPPYRLLFRLYFFHHTNTPRVAKVKHK